MAQCGGIDVSELNKLEIHLCEQLRWRLLPTVDDVHELIEAIGNPQSRFWDACTSRFLQHTTDDEASLCPRPTPPTS